MDTLDLDCDQLDRLQCGVVAAFSGLLVLSSICRATPISAAGLHYSI